MSATRSISVQSVSWPTAEMTGMRRGGDGARQRLVVEAPQILEAAAAARHDEHVRAAGWRRPRQAR